MNTDGIAQGGQDVGEFMTVMDAWGVHAIGLGDTRRDIKNEMEIEMAAEACWDEEGGRGPGHKTVHHSAHLHKRGIHTPGNTRMMVHSALSRGTHKIQDKSPTGGFAGVVLQGAKDKENNVNMHPSLALI